jgi:glycosyltransferase involved in cell wall biosynthesis
MLEAGACALPLVVSPTDGSDELVRDGQNGVVIERTPEAFAAALMALADDPARRRRMGQRARELAAGYGWPRVAAAYAEVLTCG